MTFRIIKNSTTADPTDANNNFYHIAQGSRMPMGGASMTSTDSVYDLGSSTATWKTIHCDNIYNDSITTSSNIVWRLATEFTIDPTTTTTDITGFSGDTEKSYLMFAEAHTTSGASGNFSAQLLFDTGTAYYRYFELQNTASSLTTDQYGSTGKFLWVLNAFASSSSFSVTHITCESDSYRHFNTFQLHSAQSVTATWLTNMNTVYQNTSTTVTLFRILTTTQTSMDIKLFQRG